MINIRKVIKPICFSSEINDCSVLILLLRLDSFPFHLLALLVVFFWGDGLPCGNAEVQLQPSIEPTLKCSTGREKKLKSKL